MRFSDARHQRITSRWQFRVGCKGISLSWTRIVIRSGRAQSRKRNIAFWSAETIARVVTIASVVLDEIWIAPNAPMETPMPFAPAKWRVSGSPSLYDRSLANTRPDSSRIGVGSFDHCLSRLRPVFESQAGYFREISSHRDASGAPPRKRTEARSNTSRLRSRYSAAIPVSRMNRFIATCPLRPRRHDRCRVDSASFHRRQGPPPRRWESPAVASAP